MVLRGQGDSPVRICEPCKRLEEAARFEMRYGHKNRASRGTETNNCHTASSTNSLLVFSGKDEAGDGSSNQMEQAEMGSTTPEELRHDPGNSSCLKSMGWTEDAAESELSEKQFLPVDRYVTKYIQSLGKEKLLARKMW
ncbi:hypothetical protein HAX54_015613 [Datura stramonium]|uniref:Uncharacterized protein n=1 Tax=Datura stramonium TaxID=4076 RepID=A0ABS8RGM6_DATST|nr:hypothetical protein [Datura stramonium]